VKITLESTTKIVELEVGGTKVPGRIWEGTTDSGIPVVALITRIAAETADNPDRLELFRRELEECRPPSPELEGVFPLRMVL
jgi:hypothetical protein